MSLHTPTDAESEGPEGAVRGGVGVSAHNDGAREGEALWGRKGR